MWLLHLCSWIKDIFNSSLLSFISAAILNFLENNWLSITRVWIKIFNGSLMLILYSITSYLAKIFWVKSQKYYKKYYSFLTLSTFLNFLSISAQFYIHIRRKKLHINVLNNFCSQTYHLSIAMLSAELIY